MGVGVQREAHAVVAQHTGHRLHVHAVEQSSRGKCVPLWHNKYVQYSGASACFSVAANR